MKKLLFTLLFLFLFVILKGVNPTDSVINERIRREIMYPDFARNNQETGIVTITFSLDTEGHIVVKQITGDNRVLNEYVADRIQKIAFDKMEAPSRDYTMSIEFRLK